MSGDLDMTETGRIDTNSIDAYSHLYPKDRNEQILSSGQRFNDLINHAVTFGKSSLVHQVEVSDGLASRQDLDLDKLNPNQSLSTATRRSKKLLRAFLLGYTQRSRLELSQRAFLRLLQASAAPPPYVEVFLDNNGACSSYFVNSPDGRLLKDFYLLVKLPYGPLVNGSLMFHYSFEDDCATCLLSTTSAQKFSDRFMELVQPRTSKDGDHPSQPDPMVVLSLFLDHISVQMEDERGRMDSRVCAQESKTGVALHNFKARRLAKISEYAVVKRDLHMLEGLLAMFEHMLAFQAELSAFLVEEHLKFCRIRQQGPTRIQNSPKDAPQTDYVQASLRINASMAKWRLEQVRVLSKRIQIQLKVTESSISAYNTLNALRLARNSRSDSISMKAIAALTMVFLPATLVATIFSMGFFDYASNDRNEMELKVAPQVWMYVIVTLPLTAVVLGACAVWLKWSKGKMKDEEGDGVD